jgi:hypothetical protein
MRRSNSPRREPAKRSPTYLQDREPLPVNARPEAAQSSSQVDHRTFIRLNEITQLVGALTGVLLELISNLGGADTLRERWKPH